MGIARIGLSLLKKTSAFAKTAGKPGILCTKKQKVTADTILAYKPNYDKAFESYTNALQAELEIENKQVVKNLAKTCVKEDMEMWGGSPVGYLRKLPRKKFETYKLLDIGEGPNVDATTYAMEITRKARYRAIASQNPKIAERQKAMPELVNLTEEEKKSKKVLDEAFDNITPNPEASIEYRGARLFHDNFGYQELLKLKKGDIYTEPGYMWTSPDRGYAFGNYGGEIADRSLPASCIRYNILLPKGSKMLCVDRVKAETLLKYSSKFKVENIQKAENGDINLSLVYLG